MQCARYFVHPVLRSVSLKERGKWGETSTTFCFKIPAVITTDEF